MCLELECDDYTLYPQDKLQSSSYSVVIGQMKEPSQLIENLMVFRPVTGLITHILTVTEHSDGH